MLPEVVIYNAVSLDGRIDGYDFDVSLYYSLAAGWDIDAVLIGSDTILLSPEPLSDDVDRKRKRPAADRGDTRPLAVIPDSRGRIRCWNGLRDLPYFRGVVALCSRSTPDEYLKYLDKQDVDHIIVGDDRVNMRKSLEALNARYGVKSIRVDSGGTLNGVLLREGLVTEAHVLVHPALVGGTSPRSMFRAPDLKPGESAIPLKLVYSKKLKGGIIWLKYRVEKN